MQHKCKAKTKLAKNNKFFSPFFLLSVFCFLFFFFFFLFLFLFSFSFFFLFFFLFSFSFSFFFFFFFLFSFFFFLFLSSFLFFLFINFFPSFLGNIVRVLAMALTSRNQGSWLRQRSRPHCEVLTIDPLLESRNIRNPWVFCLFWCGFYKRLSGTEKTRKNENDNS